MKMLISLFALICLVVSFSAGCATMLGQPKVGVYTYIRKPLYEGPPVRTIPIWIDKNFGEADKLAIDDAIRQWNYAMNGYVKLNVVDTQFDMEIPKIVQQVNSGGWLFLKINGDNPMVPDKKDGFWTIGFCETIGGHHLYLVRDRLANEDVFGVTLHEIGHLMGSDHVGERLMYPHYSKARFQCIDFDTIWQVSVHWELQPDRLNYCVDGAGAVSDVTRKPLDGGVGGPSCPLGLPPPH